MNAQVSTRLRQLKLSAMASALEDQQSQPATYEALAFVERLQLLLDQEWLMREQRKQQRLIHQARLKLHASLQDIDYRPARNLQRAHIAQLAQGEWLHRAQNLLVTGPTGSGKTFIACALARNACLQGHSVRYFRLPRLLLHLTQAKADGSYLKLLAQIGKTRLLLIDDWGLESLQPAHRHDIMEIMDDCCSSL